MTQSRLSKNAALEKGMEKQILKVKDFDVYDFKVFNKTKNNYKPTGYFIKVPDIFIQTNLPGEFGVNRIFLFVYCEIDRNRSYEDISFIRIRDIFEKCGYKINQRNKPKIFYEILKCLIFLRENNYIECDFDIGTISYNDCIRIRIVADTFDTPDSYTKLYGDALDTIIKMDTDTTRESILSVFLYISSYIFIRPKNQNNEEVMHNPEFKPESFWRSIESMTRELSMSKDTISRCLYCLTSPVGDKEPLLIKREVGSIQSTSKRQPQNVPNIYVLNKDGYEREIEWTISKILKKYNTRSFREMVGRNISS